MVHIVDCAESVVRRLTDLAAAGITGIIRYDSRIGHWKEAGNPEIAAILAAGMAVGIVNEGIGSVPSAFTEESGYLDACYSLARAVGRAQPEGTAIYYAVDFDASSAEIGSHVIPYFLGVQKAHRENVRRWQVGAYCSGLVAMELDSRSLIDLSWITCSGGFAGSRAYVAAGREDLWQYRCEQTLCGLDVDFNLTPTGVWGQWRTHPSPGEVADNFVQTGIASWYNDNRNADGSPVDNEHDITAAHRTLPFGTRIRATRLDNGASLGDIEIRDRGPYVAGRIVDFRPAVARSLGMIDDGVVPIRIEVE